jgi:hypothetical protein
LRVGCLQRAVVTTLIGEKEIGPAQPVEHLTRRQRLRQFSGDALQFRETACEALPRERHVVGVGIDHRQRKARRDRAANILAVERERAPIGIAGAFGLVALGERAAQVEPFAGARGRRHRDRLLVERNRLVQCAALAQQPREHHDHRA